MEPDRDHSFADIGRDHIIFSYFHNMNLRFELLHFQRKQQGDGGVMVSIVAFQAVDPGSIPGHRTLFFRLLSRYFHSFSFHVYETVLYRIILCKWIR